MSNIPSLEALDLSRFDRPSTLKALAAASRQLAELKGVAESFPNAGILINALGMQEAKDSSAIENIVTTHDELFRDAAFPDGGSASAKEVLRYRQALKAGFDAVSAAGRLTLNTILKVQEELELRDKMAGQEVLEEVTIQVEQQVRCTLEVWLERIFPLGRLAHLMRQE